MVQRIRSSTPSARLELIQFKVLHRVHFSKTRLSKIFPSIIDQCERCHSSPCNLSHMFYFCSKLNTFWSDYFDILSKVLGFAIQTNPLIAIFGVTSGCRTRISSIQSDMLAFTSLLARRCILLLWKSSKAPSTSMWLRDVMSYIKLEKIKYSVKGNSALFSHKWDPFITYFNSLQILPPD